MEMLYRYGKRQGNRWAMSVVGLFEMRSLRDGEVGLIVLVVQIHILI
jgi:hypothetical protein